MPTSSPLLDALRTACRVRHYSIRTERAYVHWTRRYCLYHRDQQGHPRHPADMAEAEVAAFLAHLDATSGGLMWLGVKALGGRDEAGSRAVGRAQGLANWFRAVPAMEARGMKPLPDGRPETVAPKRTSRRSP